MSGPEPLVETAHGPVRGSRAGDVAVFRRVPYAATPAGAARFAAPIPPVPWREVRDASGETVSMAPAPARDRIGDLDMTAISGAPWSPEAPGDYLTVNVWAPMTPAVERQPVVVFVHGGGFIGGAGSAPAYNGAALARHGLVVVTVNYRLGAAGWLHLDGAPDNRGLLDVLAALRWVQDNIGAFGGDPDRVTVMGQSAGATIVAALLAMPAATGLFRRAISQSGNALGAFTRAQAARVTVALAAVAGVPATADGFAALSDADLVRYTGELRGLDLTIDAVADPMLGLSPFSLVLDEATVAAQPATPVTGAVDLLIGTNTDEANLYLVPTAGAGDAATMSALLFGAGTEALAEAHSAAGGRTFRYEFAWRSDAFEGALGAAHTMELPFVFGTVGLPSLHGPRSLLGSTSDADLVSAVIQRAWAGFIRDGDPGWPPSSPGTPVVQRLGAKLPIKPGNWPATGYPLSPAVRKGNVVAVSGQIPVDPVTGHPVGATVTDQLEQVFRNITALLHAAGAVPDDIVSMHVYLRRHEDFAEMNAAYARLAPSPHPARTTVYMSLPGDLLVEVDAIAVLDDR
ncbi:carboxylesterase family protein [Dactylosporangium sp. CA-092794]|uniref:carboxylesterase family protein n=1 Tax=Dactylosporangium sp. CA-092794 TaxID=3239929 RepID=UPI003D8B5B12